MIIYQDGWEEKIGDKILILIMIIMIMIIVIFSIIMIMIIYGDGWE